jgi:hypothetical protein
MGQNCCYSTAYSICGYDPVFYIPLSEIYYLHIAVNETRANPVHFSTSQSTYFLFNSFIHHWFYSPLLGPGLSSSFIIIFTQTVGNAVTYNRATQTQNKSTHRHPCQEWDSNPQPQHSTERREFMP